MRIKRIVNTGFWEDKKVVDEFSVEDRYFMLYLLTNPHTTQLGIYQLPISTASNETGYNKDIIKVLLDRFENHYKVIKYSFDTGEIAIKNYLKHSIIKGGKPVYDCLVKESKNVTDKELLDYVYSSLVNNSSVDNITIIDFLEYLNIEINNDNDNDNDNERIVDDSYHDLLENIKKMPERCVIPPTLEMVKAYCESRNNGIDAGNFIDVYASKGWYIGKNKMKDWQAAVRTWERNRKTTDNNKPVMNNKFWDEA